MRKLKTTLPPDFCVLILTYKRPSNVKTLATLRAQGYTGPVFLVVDDKDPTLEQYKALYGDAVVTFSKAKLRGTFDCGDNFPGTNTVLFARIAAPEICKQLGFRYFLELDDDYSGFTFRYDGELQYAPAQVKSLDALFSIVLRFFCKAKIACLAFSQGGDFVGGVNGTNQIFTTVKALRKVMNSFFIDAQADAFQFKGRLNDDVNTYAVYSVIGKVFLTLNQVSLGQAITQANSGGLTEAYVESGTYVKSFYTVMMHPSATRISVLNGQASSRIHHAIKWRYTAPKILRAISAAPAA